MNGGWARLTKIEIETVRDRENLPDRRCRVEILGGEEEPDFQKGEGGCACRCKTIYAPQRMILVN